MSYVARKAWRILLCNEQFSLMLQHLRYLTLDTEYDILVVINTNDRTSNCAHPYRIDRNNYKRLNNKLWTFAFTHTK